MIRPSPRRAAAALTLVCLVLLPAAGHAAPRPGKAGSATTAMERITAGPLSGLLDRLATLLRPEGAVSKRGSSLDPNGATGERDRRSGLDPDGATSENDRGSGIDPNG
jgi:hypothetical protein